MPNRRQFLREATAATAGVLCSQVGSSAAVAQFHPQPGTASRRQIVLGGRRIRTVDVHAHCLVPEVMSVLEGSPLAQTLKTQLAPPLLLGPDRLRAMDAHGIDVEALSINAFWYGAERPLAHDIVEVQNRVLSAWCASHPDRFVALASVALQHPDLAAEQLHEAVTKLGMRGAAIGGSVEGEELSARRFDPFWAMAEQLGVVVFMHPQAASGTTQNARLQGKGALGNTIGNPLETTVFLSHLIFEGTLDRFPNLKICAAHAGGYLASYSGRSDAYCRRESGRADCAALKKRPSEYFKRELFVDTMIFSEEGLRHLVAECGASQIVYGTDHPYDWPVGVDLVLNAPFLNDAQREAILGGNAAKLLRLP